MDYDVVITNGVLLSAEGETRADVAIRGEKIAAVGPGLAAESRVGAEIIDATGRQVIPGGVDVHVHLELPFCGTVSSDDWNTGTRAAARGGVTTVIDFAIPYGQETLARRLSTTGWPGPSPRRASIIASTWPSPTGIATAPRWRNWSGWAARPSRNS